MPNLIDVPCNYSRKAFKELCKGSSGAHEFPLSCMGLQFKLYCHKANTNAYLAQNQQP